MSDKKPPKPPRARKHKDQVQANDNQARTIQELLLQILNNQTILAGAIMDGQKINKAQADAITALARRCTSLERTVKSWTNPR